MAQNPLLQIFDNARDALLERWVDEQANAPGFRSDRIGRAELTGQSRRFIELLHDGLRSGSDDIQGSGFTNLRQMLDDLSISRAQQGFSPRETALFVFSLKGPLSERIVDSVPPADRAAVVLRAGALVDELGIYTMEVYQRGREQVILRQQDEMLELSTPVVTLWDGVLALPLIGTLDSARTQVVMESLLHRIVDSGAAIAIIDITGVPTVDTLTAQHLLKTVAAARLMGAECIISGIRPQIAQTIVHLGVDLGTVMTKATLADAFAVALTRRGLSVQPAAAARTRIAAASDTADDSGR